MVPRIFAGTLKHLVRRSSQLILRSLLLLSVTFLIQFARSANVPGQTSNENKRNTSAIATLEPGKLIEREISAGEKQSYQLEISEGQYANIEITSPDLDASIKLLDSTRELIIEYAAKLTATSNQEIELVAEATRAYRFDVERKSADSRPQTYTIRFVTSHRASDQELWTYQAVRYHYQASTLIAAGKYDEALAQEDRALALREKALGPESSAVASSLHQLGNIDHVKGNYPQAETALQRALTIRESTSGPESTDVFTLLVSLGGLYYDMGELDKAEQFMQRATVIQGKGLNLDQGRVIALFNNFALVYYAKGEYAAAEEDFERAITIEQQVFGSGDSKVADTLINLAALYQAMGDYLKMESTGQRALAIYEKVLDADNPDIGNTVLSLGNARYLRGDLEHAEPFYQRALHIYEKALGPEHPLVALALNNLAEVYHDRREFAQAEPRYLRSLAIREKKLGDLHSDVGQSLNNLGNLYRDQGDYGRAEQFYKRALATREKALGPEHPDVVSTLSNISLLYMDKGDFAEAQRFQSRAIAISERNTALNLSSGSERQKLAYLDSLSEQLDRAVTLSVKLAPENAAAGDLALATVLQRKGRVQDVLSGSLVSLRRRLNLEDAKLLDRFNETTAQLSRLVLAGPQQLTAKEFQQRNKELNEQRERLEAEIARRSAAFRAQSQPVTIDAVRKALPDNAALLEFVSYRPLSPKGITAKERYGAPRYVVYVIRNQGEVRWRELGGTKEVDGAVQALRQALRNPQRKDTEQLARILDATVMQPVRALLGDATQLLVSPDGELNLVPFAALVDEHGRYLIQRYSFTYLTSGRDLLRMQVARESKSGPLVVANPSFGEQATTVAVTPNSTSPRSLTDAYFAPLAATENEARSIQTLFPDATVLTGMKATETAVKQVAAPRILHLATHGFFLSEPAVLATASESVPPAVAGGSRTQTAETGTNSGAASENPLLRSGLAFAGANLRNGKADDGVLTALEASGLNLWGTKLVVLSACDTGVGEVRTGEGVYGLRRAFTLAGAESLVMSLWPISDFTTRTLMTSYYQNLKQGMGRGEALRQVQLDMLKKNPKLHPFYWANFIQSGDWGDLEGRR
jgi:CHAT domain-containing protein/Tfp pilus assembly protein PilF